MLYWGSHHTVNGFQDVVKIMTKKAIRKGFSIQNMTFNFIEMYNVCLKMGLLIWNILNYKL